MDVFNTPIETKEQEEARMDRMRVAARKIVAEKVHPQMLTEAQAAAGGNQALGEVMEWAGKNLSPQELRGFEADLEDTNSYCQAIAEVRNRMELAAPGEAFAESAAAGGCANEAEVRECMEIARKRSPASKVGAAMAKLARTPEKLVGVGIGTVNPFPAEGGPGMVIIAQN